MMRVSFCDWTVVYLCFFCFQGKDGDDTGGAVEISDHTGIIAYTQS